MIYWLYDNIAIMIYMSIILQVIFQPILTIYRGWCEAIVAKCEVTSKKCDAMCFSAVQLVT